MCWGGKNQLWEDVTDVADVSGECTVARRVSLLHEDRNETSMKAERVTDR